ncbi:pyridoxal 5'-phosphate synthase [Actinospica durhamensis]|uniref:Pyridoxal 5'-phosphate synthase n=1 Tax=Actinospica durhamensis TaxID=1508375 RepID=A0A941EUR9_9ACTN|nr:pyridoxal 5'-phosphate synthase [Actinospica durhamensis]MBR7838502.1 pyridoxal 5'-phosphate synthase [Actinospica durhamensis]
MTDIRAYLRGLDVFAGELPAFDPDAAPDRPETLFVDWLTTAVEAGVREPHAMTLSTIGTDGTPSARVLILKNVDAHGWQFAAHGSSPKGRDLAGHPAVALTFYWSQQARQVRVRGPVEPASAQDSAADFLARSAGSRAEASTGRQSRPLEDRQTLDLATKQALERIAEQPDLVIPEWTLYTVRAEQVEFWQADKQRKHTRLRYERHGDTWTRGQLWP